MSEQRTDTVEKFSRRGEDHVTPEEKIYPLRFIVDYVAQKKSLLLGLEGQSLHQALAIQDISEDIMRQGRKLYGEPEDMPEEHAKMYSLLMAQQKLIHDLTVGLTKKGLAFEDMDNMLQQAQPFILRLMFRDSLTDTYNRYFFISRSDDLMEQAEKTIGFSLAFLDIDNFKKCNDVYGHEFGDEALKYLCRTVNQHLQVQNLKHTYFVRMGGDEFILISNELAFPYFVFLLDDLQKKISSGTIHWEDLAGKITVSIGAANTVFSSLNTPWELYRKADGRLYDAKHKGKNCIVSS
ncbi:MAG: GGDEF domain-containing protein [Selenomonadaceae bacterium]|nr:GGDEF domain-containing protein [Selenomonadaceae bacterium]